MLPYPVDTLASLITQVSTIKIATQKEHKLYLPAIFQLQLLYLYCFFLSPLVGICEISGRFAFYQNWQFAGYRILTFDDNINGHIDAFTIPSFRKHIKMK